MQLEERILLSVGGGWTGSGILGSYYTGSSSAANQTQANLKFTRTDDRIDFLKGSLKPGGSADPQFAAVAATNFSVLWQGSLIAKYSEQYVFKYFADDTLTVAIAHHGQGDWTTFINQSSYTGAWASVNAPYAFQSGDTYDIKVTFSQGSGPWAAQLHWLSNGGYSFAEEAIEPATPVGVNYEPGAQKFADVMKYSGGFRDAPFGNPVATDSAGYPTTDFNVQLFYNGGEYGGNTQGTYTLQFDGQAQVAASWGASLDFKVGSTDYGATLPKGAGYNGTTTTATMVVPASGVSGQLYVKFSNTQRNGGAGAGVTNIHLWRPTTLNGTTTAQPGTLLTNAALAEAQPFTALRMMDWTGTNNSTEVHWSDRTTPASLFWGVGTWETAVAAANESGKDIYINIPQAASFPGDELNSYVTNLAKLFKYGSDGVNPYTSAQSNPVWAPLNSNLNIYIEYSNETWNWNGNYSRIVQTVADNQTRDTADWQLFASAGGWVNTSSNSVDNSLWALTRAVDASNIFRSVFGDAAMPNSADPRVRPVFEWQYGGGFNGGSDSSTKALTNLQAQLPHDIDYYLWGGGGAWYADDRVSGFADAQFANPNFDSGTTGWTFSSGAGIVANGDPMGNPDVPTDVNPAAPAKTTTNAVYLAPGASISQSVYFSGGYANLTLYSAQTVSYDSYHSIVMSIDGVPISRSEGDILQNAYDWIRSAAVNVTQGYHTVTFSSTLPSGTVYLGNVGIQTVNGLFAETTPSYQQNNINITNTIATDSAIDAQFGLHHVGYEGGFDFDGNLTPWHTTTSYQHLGDKGYSSGTPNVGMYANLDSRTTPLAINTLDEYFQAGGAMPFIFQSDGNINSWGVMVPSLYNSVGAATTIPKVEAVAAVQQALPAGHSPTLPVGWSDTDIGSVGVAGSGVFDGTTWTVKGSGSDIWNASDQFNFVSQTWQGDGQIVAKVTSVQNTNGWAKSGVMFRDTTATGSAYAAVEVTPSNGVAFQWRSTTGANAQNVQATGLTAPVWVKLVRAGTSFSAYYSTDGSTWTQIGTAQSVAMGSSALAGLEVTSLNNSVLNTSTFTDVVVETALNDADVGSVGTAGSASYKMDTGVWTVSGSGTDIWGNTDAFNFASQTWTGNGQIVSQVDSVQNTNAWARSGVMFRDSTAAGAMYAAVFVTPSNGVTFQWRSSTNGGTSMAQVTGLAAPLWVKLIRLDNTFTGYYSTDGNTWTEIGTTQTIAMSSSALAGLAVGAVNNSALNTSTFTNVHIGQVGVFGTIASWELAGTASNATSAPVDVAADGFTVSDLTLGSGFVANHQGFSNGLMAQSPTNAFAPDLATAITKNQFETFTITPEGGHLMSLSSILLRSWFQNAPSGRGINLAYSTDGTNFTSIGTATGSAADAPTFDVTNISALQNVAGAVAFRVYLFGGGPYTTVGLGNRTGNDVVVSGYYATVPQQALATWDLAGTASNATAAPVDSAATGYTVSDLTLGSGFVANHQGFSNGLMAQSPSNHFAPDLATAVADNQFETFAITTQTGHTMSLGSVLLQSWFQNTPSGRGMALAYSTDGTNFTTAESVTGSAADSHTFDLSSVSALQNFSGTVTFRVYLFGGGPYTTIGLGNRSGNDVVVSSYVV